MAVLYVNASMQFESHFCRMPHLDIWFNSDDYLCYNLCNCTAVGRFYTGRGSINDIDGKMYQAKYKMLNKM